MRYDAHQSRRTHDRVLTEASRMLRRVGPHRLCVKDVMNRAGLTHGGFYAHFTSKDELIAAALEFAFLDASSLFKSALEECGPREALTAYVCCYLSMAHLEDSERGCPLPALASDLPRLQAATRALYADGVRRLNESLEKLIDDCGIADATNAAASVVAELVGAISIARAEPDRQQAEQTLKRSRLSIARRLGLKEDEIVSALGRLTFRQSILQS